MISPNVNEVAKDVFSHAPMDRPIITPPIDNGINKELFHNGANTDELFAIYIIIIY